MNKIVIIGISGAGKTSAANIISQKTGLPLYHMDQLWWGENWNEQKEKEVEKKVHEIINQDTWILEGYVEPLGKERFETADIILYLDYSGITSCLGVIKRWIKYKGSKRPEMPNGCSERWNTKYFLNTILLRKERPEIEDLLKGFEKKIVRVRTRRQLINWIKNNLGKNNSFTNESSKGGFCKFIEEVIKKISTIFL